MNFYEVWVRTLRYRSAAPLTYQTPQDLAVGSLVQVELQREIVWAIVVAKVTKPNFKTKPVVNVSALPPLPEALIKLGSRVQNYYAAPLGVTTGLLLPSDLPKASAEAPDTIKPQLEALPPLTAEQERAIKICSRAGTFLLHGKTGSGKTRVYLELARRALEQGRSAIILTPEISLTSQLAAQFQHTFGNQVIVLHSGLTPRERREAWGQMLIIRKPVVAIGARSTIFSPLANVGLIVVDEAHEPAYKQETAPYYHASRVASMLALIHDASLLLGSATPSVSDYYVAEQKQTPIIGMHSLATQSAAISTRLIVDATDRSLFNRSTLLSQPLIEALQHSIERHTQGMLYLNRRGTARIILCDQCGWQALCPHCDLPLTYHADTHVIMCHSCNYRGPAPISCPVCSNPSIIYKSAGTKSIFDEVQRLFPEARVQRFDTDNTKAERLEQHYAALKNGDVDILVGTQLLAKGLDLPKLSTVGVINADSSLCMPDFSSQDRTYQLLSQVLGRVGRGHGDSTAVIQTYNPASVAIKAAIEDNWGEFYEAELRERQKYNFPPFVFLLKLTVRRASSRVAEKAALTLLETLQKTHPRVIVEGPAPSFHYKIAGKYEWQLVVKAKQRSALLDIIHELPPSGWTYDIDPINLL
jgi:primosomal protein N' (replication factor Y)